MRTMRQRFARIPGGAVVATLFAVSMFGVGLAGVASANSPPSAARNVATDVKELQAQRAQIHELFDRVQLATAQVKERLNELNLDPRKYSLVLAR